MLPSAVLRKQLTSAGPTLAQGLAYATDLVRRADHEAIYASYFYPAAVRPAYLALRALNVELAGLPDQVSNQMVGRMRYQWWKDAVKDVFEGKPHAHPLVSLIAHLPQRPFLSPYHFSRLIAAREAHFLNPTFSTLRDLADYSSGTQASLLYLLLQVTAGSPFAGTAVTESGSFGELRHAKPFEHVGGEHDRVTKIQQPAKPADDLVLDHAASHLAVAVTITTLLRSIPFHAARRVNVIPLEVAGRHALQEESLFRNGPEARGLQDAVATLVGIAEAELKTARQCFDGTTGLPARAIPVFLAATPSRSFLERLSSSRVDYNPFDSSLQKRYWKLPFQVWSDARKGRF
ncbi:hypothetical protein JCM8547_006230 [Rhodosporidiobolus lusitaniae]